MMPPLVDSSPPFIPPPHGASNGGQPGYYPPFSGYHPSWPPPPSGTPYPTIQTQLPNWPVSPNDPPTSAQSWTYGNYPPVSPHPWGPQVPAWGQTQNASWGVQTPGGTWGAPSPAGSYGPPQTPYSPWVQQPQRPTPQQSYNPPGTPFDSASGQPITAGWFDAGKNEAVGRGREKKKSVRHRSPMRRSNSQGPPVRFPLQRSISYGAGGDFHHPYYAESFDAQNLARRPRDWRSDFDARAGLASYIPRVGKARSDVQEFTDPVRRTLHPLLLHTPNRPPVYHDLRDHPLALEYIEFRNLQRDHNDIDFAQLVLQPSCHSMRLFHPRLPWYIDIQQSHPNGVTVYDVFSQMNQQLHFPIQGKHYWTEELGDSDRTSISAAFQDRCKGDPGRITTGVLKVDFLGKKPIFEGLARSSKGLWEIKTSTP